MADALLSELRAAAGLARTAGADDTVDGVPARYVAAPRSTQQAAATVRVAAGHDLAIVVRGGGTRQDWGAPPRRRHSSPA